VVLAALATARRALPEHAHRYSPKKFTQHQLFACLVLKNFLRTDYRGLAAHLEDHPSLRAILVLKQVPHFTTFQKASRRLLRANPARRLLEATVRLQMGRKRRVKRAAIDSTGLECSCASGYFVRRRKRVTEAWKTVVYHHYPKLGVVCDGDDHFILAGQVGRGPRPDVDEFRPLVAEALRIVRLSQLAADAGYDSEPNHRFARDQHGVRTIIPAKHGRPTDKLPTGRYRRLMKVRFDRPAYRRRSQIETVISMIKRRQGAHVHGRSYHGQCRDLRLLVLTHNVMILVVVQVFYRAVLTHFSDSEKSGQSPKVRMTAWPPLDRASPFAEAERESLGRRGGNPCPFGEYVQWWIRWVVGGMGGTVLAMQCVFFGHILDLQTPPLRICPS